MWVRCRDYAKSGGLWGMPFTILAGICLIPVLTCSLQVFITELVNQPSVFFRGSTLRHSMSTGGFPLFSQERSFCLTFGCFLIQLLGEGGRPSFLREVMHYNDFFIKPLGNV